MNRTVLFLSLLVICSCSNRKSESQDFDYKRIEKIADSTKVQNIVIHNLFKSQILAHKNNHFDASMIVKNVYLPHKKLWDNCYGVIFGDENAHHFNNNEGMINWNKTLFDKNKNELVKKSKAITDIDINKVMKRNLEKFDSLVPYTPSAEISILFTPMTGIGFGGYNAAQFALELNNKSLDINYAIERGLPHELNHLVYEKLRNRDEDSDSALSQTIDEGFACYFTFVFFDKQIPEHEAIEKMTKENWDWYRDHEKEIFLKTKPYFSDTSGDNPLLRNDKFNLFPEAPKSLNYWLGYRIISKYVEKYGKDSWKDVYTLTANEVLLKSEYEKYIDQL